MWSNIGFKNRIANKTMHAIRGKKIHDVARYTISKRMIKRWGVARTGVLVHFGHQQ